MRRSARAGAVAIVALLAVVGVGGCSDKGGNAQQLCALVGDGRTFSDVFQQGLDPTDTDRALAQLRAATVDLEQLHDAAPSAVRGALRDELAYVAAVTKVLERMDPDDAAGVVAAVNGLKDERVAATKAAADLRTYQEAHCGTSTSG